tara:strand:- start:144 stop:590 length:447 start_codon:yes stop_codon:yes gene_type:complete
MLKKYTILFFLLFLKIQVSANEINIISDRLEINDNTNESIFIGNVYAEEDTFKIWSEKMVVKFNESRDQVDEIESFYDVKIHHNDMTANSDQALYLPDTQILRLTGNVHITQDGNQIKCEELILDIKNSTSIMNGNSIKRLEAIIISE